MKIKTYRNTRTGDRTQIITTPQGRSYVHYPDNHGRLWGSFIAYTEHEQRTIDDAVKNGILFFESEVDV